MYLWLVECIEERTAIDLEDSAIYESQRGPNECIPFSLQPCMSSALPTGLDVISTTVVRQNMLLILLVRKKDKIYLLP